jgi:hypothetical protein
VFNTSTPERYLDTSPDFTLTIGYQQIKEPRYIFSKILAIPSWKRIFEFMFAITATNSAVIELFNLSN